MNPLSSVSQDHQGQHHPLPSPSQSSATVSDVSLPDSLPSLPHPHLSSWYLPPQTLVCVYSLPAPFARIPLERADSTVAAWCLRRKRPSEMSERRGRSNGVGWEIR